MKTTAPLYIALHEALRRLGTAGPLAAPGLHDHVEDYIAEMCALHLPHGSGFDDGVHLRISRYISDRTRGGETERLVFNVAFHHMNDAGDHTGRAMHQVWVTPVFGGIKLRCDGPSRSDIKGYILEAMCSSLTDVVPTFDAWAYDAGLCKSLTQPKEKT